MKNLKFFNLLIVLLIFLSLLIFCDNNKTTTTTTTTIVTTTVSNSSTTITTSTTIDTNITTTTSVTTPTTITTTTTTTTSTSSTSSTTTTTTTTTTSSTYPPNWLFMVYMDGDCDLESFAVDDFNEMETVDLRGYGVKIIVLFDRTPNSDSGDGYSTADGNWYNTRLYEVLYDASGYNTTTVSTRLSGMGLTATGGTGEELNMGDGQTVSDFVNYCKSNFYATNYALFFWNHGGGWRKKSKVNKSDFFITRSKETRATTKFSYFTPDREKIIQEITKPKGGYKSACWDESSGDDYLSTKEIYNALGTNTVSVLGFDACLMSMLEVANEFKTKADIMIASEESEPGDGWDYITFLSNFRSSTQTKEDLASCIVSSYSNYFHSTSETTLSAIDLSRVGTLLTSLDSFINDQTNTARSNLKEARLNTNVQTFDNTMFIDLYNYADQFATASATQLKDAITNAVIANYCSSDYNTYGISIYFPTHCFDYELADYVTSNISFVNDTKWRDLIDYYCDVTNGQPLNYFCGFEEPLSSEWEMSSYPWARTSTIYHNGSWSLNSTDINNSQLAVTELIVGITNSAGANLSFWWKVSSEEDYDYLDFYANYSGVYYISGNVDWQNRTYSLSQGTYVFAWVYSKDGSDSSGSDCGWLDDVQITEN